MENHKIDQKFKFKGSSKIKFKALKLKKINPRILYSILVAVGLMLGFAAQYHFNKPNFGTFIDSDMDPAGNVYVLGVEEDKEQYKITKVKENSTAEYSINMEKSTDKIEYSYGNLGADSKGNFYVIKQSRNKKAVVSDKSAYPILEESVLMYNTNGKYIKQVANMDFKEDVSPPTKSYIIKLQIVDQAITLVGIRNNICDIISVNPLVDESPKKSRSFEVKPATEQADKNTDWVNDVAVLSNGRVLYSTLKGDFFAMDNQGSFLDYTNVISRETSSLVGFSVDSSDNLYFTDALSGNFYRLNTRSISADSLYKLGNDISGGKGIQIRDLRRIWAIGEDDYYAASKDFTNPYHIRFGSSSQIISDIHGQFFPWGLLIMVLTAAAFVGIIWGIVTINKKGIKRIPVYTKITVFFLPVYLLAMGALLYVSTSDATDSYISTLRADQDTGVKIVVDNIDKNDFLNVHPVSDYLTSGYTSLKKSIESGYSSLASKVGDRSDYIVTYFVNADKIYSSLSSKYATASSSYNELRFSSPDMVPKGMVLADVIFERDELQTLYNAWNTLKDVKNTASSARAIFRDVHGDVSASFVAVKDTDGNAIGFVGNFLDEYVHKETEFWKIFKHSASIVLITAVFIFAYMCLLIQRVLRPLKKIEKGINAISRGEWNTRMTIASRDEFADISSAFNLMSERLDRYTSNLTILNKEYVRYVPKEFFKLMGKDKITKVNLHDYKKTDMNMLYLTFNLSAKGNCDFENEEELFNTLIESFEEIFKIIEKNNGLVVEFDGLGITTLFPTSAQDAFNASEQFKEIPINKKIKENMNITLGAGEIIIGVGGDDTRRGVIVVSDDIMQIVNIDSHLKTIGVNHVATKSIIDKLEKNTKCNYRFIGKFENISSEDSTDVYEIIDMTNAYKRDLYISTKELFEKAVELYISAEFYKARKILADVLRVNEKDAVSIHYLIKCDEQINKSEHSYDKKKWTGCLID
ncbi:MAG: HAMP domain-containing protein [Oscillospiraceae bacterium]|jgi:HAMP domain-containing protein|nr:HAMP domain-containing protein [Oscillospiraceae bacterium]